jgi:hypothetical protein
MKLSAKRRQAIYAAIHESVIQARIKLSQMEIPPQSDFVVAQIERQAAEGVFAVLQPRVRSEGGKAE